MSIDTLTEQRPCSNFKCSNKPATNHCISCTAAMYCSSKCQHQHFSLHRKFCERSRTKQEASIVCLSSEEYANLKPGHASEGVVIDRWGKAEQVVLNSNNEILEKHSGKWIIPQSRLTNITDRQYTTNWGRLKSNNELMSFDSEHGIYIFRDSEGNLDVLHAPSDTILKHISVSDIK